ncbi:MDR/zinc-dependent alcohol dehydrogenase-like family protein [Caballeronia cordobensis]|uniref:zinc-binding dehydrogenase n=1 Tax=Caballeronia cordobensis TaxID=1353886 RepID=UPI0009E7C87C
MAKVQGFRTINLVRREEQVDEIKALGGDVVLCTADESWLEQLKTATGDHGIVSAIDCVAGHTGATLARHLAPTDACSSMEPCPLIVRLARRPSKCRCSLRRLSTRLPRCAAGSSSRGSHARG